MSDVESIWHASSVVSIVWMALLSSGIVGIVWHSARYSKTVDRLVMDVDNKQDKGSCEVYHDAATILAAQLASGNKESFDLLRKDIGNLWTEIRELRREMAERGDK